MSVEAPILDDDRWCPHCGGRLGPPRRGLVDTCFDDVRHEIVPASSPPIHVTPSEWRLLDALREGWDEAAGKSRPMSRVYLLQVVCGTDEREDKIIDVFICHLRAKLSGTPYAIKTRWGRGYYLCRREDAP